MADPRVPLGYLNKLLGSVIVPSNESLNVTASYLGEEMTRLSFGGPAVTRLNVATGQVPSLEPYIPMTLRINLLKTQALVNLWKATMESFALIGDVTVTPDTTTLNPYVLVNSSIGNVDPLDFNGKSAGWIVEVSGYYLVNSTAWG